MQLDADAVAEIVMMAVEIANAPLLSRIAVLEANTDLRLQAKDGAQGEPGAIGPTGPQGEKGDRGDPADESLIEELRAELKVVSDELRQIKSAPDAPDPNAITAIVQKAVAEIEIPKPLSVTASDFEPLIIAQVSKAVAALPPAKDGEPGRSADMDEVEALIRKKVDELPKPVDGKSVSVDDVRPAISEEVARVVALIPKPQDGAPGKSVEPSEVEALVRKAVDEIPKPKDGEQGHPGPAGRDGVDGNSIDPSDVELMVQKVVDALPKPQDGTSVTTADVEPLIAAVVAKAVTAIPKPKDGEQGPPGRDGTLENLKVSSDGERTVTFCFKDGTPIEGGSVTFPVVIYRDVYEEGRTYQRGDCVTWGGNMHIAAEQTSAKPGTADKASRAWILAVRKGSEGKRGLDGKVGPRGPIGPEGPVREKW